MPLLHAMRSSRATIAALMAVGLLWGGFAALVPDIKRAVGASDAELGGALLMAALGGMLALALAPRLGRALGRWALPLAGAVVSVAFVLPGLAVDVVTLGAAMLAMGVAVAFLDITANVEISAREAQFKAHLMNVNHAMFSFAFAAAAFGTGIARQAGFGPTGILPVLALLSAGLVLLMWGARSAITTPDTSEPQSRQFPWLVVGLCGLILFAAFIGENATEAWSALHIERTLGAGPGAGSVGPAMLGLVMGFGRLFGQAAAARLGQATLIFWSALLGVAGALTIAAAINPAMAVAGVAVSALGMAVIVPSANSILGSHVTQAQRSLALSRVWMLGMFGFFLGPAMIGGVAELWGLRWSFVAVAIVVALIMPAVWLLRRQPRG